MPRAGDNKTLTQHSLFERSKVMSTTIDQADALAQACAKANWEVATGHYEVAIEAMAQRTKDICCLVELLEVVEAAEEQSKDGFMFRCDPNKLKNALTALRAKLPKEMQT